MLFRDHVSIVILLDLNKCQFNHHHQQRQKHLLDVCHLFTVNYILLWLLIPLSLLQPQLLPIVFVFFASFFFLLLFIALGFPVCVHYISTRLQCILIFSYYKDPENWTFHLNEHTVIYLLTVWICACEQCSNRSMKK